MQHAKNWHKQGLVGQPLSKSHEVSLQKHLTKLLSSPSFQWFSRDLFWQELCRFGVDNSCDASEDVFLECLSTVNTNLRINKSMREQRRLEPFVGPQTFADRDTDKIAYCGSTPRAFKYFHRAIFWEEVCKSDPAARLSSVSERTFVDALQATTNRMSNWSMCRTNNFPSFTGPQVYSHRYDSERMCVGDVPAPQPAHDTSDLFGWLQCSLCSKWRRVTAAGVQTWGEQFHESHVRRCKVALQTETFVERVQVAVIDFAEFSREVADWVAHQSESLCARSALLAALEVLHDRGEQKFQAEYSECLAAYPGAKFQCDELIGCVCAMDCDTRVFEETSDNFAD